MLYQCVGGLCTSSCSRCQEVATDILQGICFVYSRVYSMLHNMLYQHKNNHHILTKHLGHHQGLNPGSFEYWMQH